MKDFNYPTPPHYQFEASYHYSDGERYNAGRGLAVISDDLKRLESVMESFRRRDETYALAITRLDTGDVVISHGDMAGATRSMNKAYRERYPRP